MGKDQEKILDKLHWYVAVGDPALIKGVDKAIQLIEELEQLKQNNPYLSYSMSTLETMAQQYAFMLGNGQTTIGDGQSLGEAYEQVCEAMEERENTDYCKHGNFRWTDHDIPCGACEME